MWVRTNGEWSEGEQALHSKDGAIRKVQTVPLKQYTVICSDIIQTSHNEHKLKPLSLRLTPLIPLFVHALHSRATCVCC